MISENVRRNWSACFFIKLVDPTPPPTGHAVLPYIRGLTEPLTRTLRKYDIRVSNKPIKSHQYMSSVLKTQTCNRRSYLAETIGLYNHTICFKIANNACMTNDHSIDFDNGIVIDKETYRRRS